MFYKAKQEILDVSSLFFVTGEKADEMLLELDEDGDVFHSINL